MKIGIATIFRTGNYGGTLQAYALKQAICENAYGEAEIINYCCDSINGKITLDFVKKAGIFRTLISCVEKGYYYPRMKKVNAFIDSFVDGEILKKSDLPMLNERYDIFLSGSDQLWNPGIQQGDNFYLLDFVNESKKKRSYGSSFGVKSIDAQYEASYKELLSRYDCITVREQAGADLIQKLIGCRAEIVLDPTLLLTSEQWEERIPSPLFDRDYIFVYQMAHSSKIAKVANRARKIWKDKVLFIPFPIGGYCKCKPRLNLSSLEWVRAVHDSRFVITDSFHGTVFAILFSKPFYYVVTSETVKSRISRIETLLSTLGLKERIVTEVSECNFNEEIDYTDVHRKLNLERERSLAILKEILQ